MSLNSRKQLLTQLREGLEERAAFVQAQIDVGLPLQIRLMRERRGWSQQEVAQRMDTSQNAISRIESLSYGKPTLSTLKKLAETFDVGLVVQFVPFSELVKWTLNKTTQSVAVPPFDEDEGFADLEVKPPDAGALESARVSRTEGQVTNGGQQDGFRERAGFAANARGRYSLAQSVVPINRNASWPPPGGALAKQAIGPLDAGVNVGVWQARTAQGMSRKQA